jgi:hypothetical protein
VVPSHEVFQKPLKVDLRFEDHGVHDNYRHYPGGDKLGETIRVWKVQTKRFPEIDPGMVSDPYGFGDSPDAEVIPSGLNSKGPDSVALARHGNFFLWGFSAPPKDMTPEARKCFVNAVCYIKKFDGQKPIVRKSGNGREWALLYSSYVKQFGDQDFIKDLFPEDVCRRFGKDPEKYIKYYTENLEYLLRSQNVFLVDEDVKSLGPSNRRVELLETCVSMLERGDRTDLASRVLKRYTTESFSDAKRWRSWLNANRHRLFFTDVDGFKFLVAPESLALPSRPAEDRASVGIPKGPDAREPVAVAAELSPERVRAGEALDFVVRVQTAPSWHIYAVGGSSGPGIPAPLRLKLPEGVEAVGEWVGPEPARGRDGQMIHEGTLAFRRRLRVAASAADGPLEVECQLGYQACDPSSCRAPTRTDLRAKAEVVGATAGR